MVTTAPSETAAVPRTRSLGLDPNAVWAWVLTVALVLYLGIDGGGYDLVVRSHAGVAIWWILLIGAALGLLPASRVGRTRRVVVVLFAAFAAWSTASTLWSLSSERSLDEASRLAAYLGILWLASVSFGDRERTLPHVAGALATAIFVIGALALLGRLHPGLFPGATATSSALPGTRSRLSWPLNYWNALGALMAFGTPLLLALATTARRAWARAAAAAAVPAVVLCGYLTFSRTSAVAAGLALVIFLALAPARILKVATIAICGAGGALLVAETVHRHAIENGLSTSAASTEGRSLLVLVLVVCVVVGLAQLALTVGVRRFPALSGLTVSPRAARVATVAGIVVIVAVALALGAPHRLDHALQTFKNPNGAHVHSNTIARFTAFSGNGRYTYWKTAIDALPGHWLGGFGVGTFQLVWLPRAPFDTYIVNAHSLYVETLTEVGIIGLALLVAFLVALLAGAVRALRAVDPAARCLAAAAVAACVSFMLSAGFDWVWQVPVVPVAFLLLVGAVLAPSARDASANRDGVPNAGNGPSRRQRVGALAPRVATVLVGLGCLGLIGTPMAMTEAIRRSQTDAGANRTPAALSAAQTAINAEPGAASPYLQAALVLELDGRFGQAIRYANTATKNEPDNWNAWLTLSRLAAEDGQSRLTLTAFARARRLNPQSPLLQR